MLNGGSYSEASGISADGKVVVGTAADGGGRSRAFRWTASTRMQTGEDWLRGSGAVPCDITYTAYFTNRDGSVVQNRPVRGGKNWGG